MPKLRLWLVAAMMTPAIHLEASISPVSYDMPNGESGTYHYWDESYDGTGNNMTDGAALSGGLGDLTDGIVATENWQPAESPPGPGPYVGWKRNPVIVFHFARAHAFDVVRIHFEDGNDFGGVSTPRGVSINGVDFSVTDPPSRVPFFAEFDISGSPSTDTLAIQLQRDNSWVFASEFEFTAVPLPGAVWMLGAALMGLLGMRSRWRQ